MGLLPFSAPVKPLADIVGRYTRCDGHQETNEQLHANTSFLLPEWSYVWAATQLYHISTHGTRNRRLSTPLFSSPIPKSPLYFGAVCGIMMLPKSLPLFPVWREGQHLLGVNAFGRAYCSLPYPSSCGKNSRGIRHSLGRARGSASLCELQGLSHSPGVHAFSEGLATAAPANTEGDPRGAGIPWGSPLFWA